jgi:hypothetical protein
MTLFNEVSRSRKFAAFDNLTLPYCRALFTCMVPRFSCLCCTSTTRWRACCKIGRLRVVFGLLKCNPTVCVPREFYPSTTTPRCASYSAPYARPMTCVRRTLLISAYALRRMLIPCVRVRLKVRFYSLYVHTCISTHVSDTYVSFSRSPNAYAPRHRRTQAPTHPSTDVLRTKLIRTSLVLQHGNIKSVPSR